MSKHTPGPWTVEPFGVVKVIMAGDKTIAKVSADNLANARLIAAAPQLLAALQQWAADHDQFRQLTPATARMMRAALASAQPAMKDGE